MYRNIVSDADCIALQKDLDFLSEWSQKWGLKFNTDKCKIMHISRRSNYVKHLYYLNGVQLGETTEEKYLGITVDCKLSFAPHVNNVVANASKRIGVIHRVFGKCSNGIKLRLYNSLVLPTLEYCCTVWNPYLLGQQRQLEKVQKRATRVVLGNFNVSYCQALEKLNFLSLHTRRTSQRVLFCFKMLHGMVALSFDDYFEFRQCRELRGTHPLMLDVPHSRTDLHKNSFFSQTPVLWNDLPPSLCDQFSLNVFKTGLTKILFNKQNCSGNCHIM